MGVDAFIFMLLIDMTLFTGNLFLRINGVIVRDHATQDLMILCPMAVRTLHINFATHMDVVVLSGEVEALIKVAVFDAVPAAAIEVTFATVLARRCAD